MNAPFSPNFVAALAMSGSVALLAACSPSTDTQTAGQKLDSAVAKVEQKAADVKSDIGAASTTAARSAEKGAENATDKVKDMAITPAVNAQLVADPSLSALKIDVDTLNGRVVLRGKAPSATSRDHASTLASRVDGVMGIDNQLVVESKS